MRAVHIWWSSPRVRITFSASAVGCTARANGCTDVDRAWRTSVSCVLRIQRARYERRRQAERLTRLKCIEVYRGLKWNFASRCRRAHSVCARSKPWTSRRTACRTRAARRPRTSGPRAPIFWRGWCAAPRRRRRRLYRTHATTAPRRRAAPRNSPAAAAASRRPSLPPRSPPTRRRRCTRASSRGRAPTSAAAGGSTPSAASARARCCGRSGARAAST